MIVYLNIVCFTNHPALSIPQLLCQRPNTNHIMFDPASLIFEFTKLVIASLKLYLQF